MLHKCAAMRSGAYATERHLGTIHKEKDPFYPVPDLQVSKSRYDPSC